MMMVYSHSVMSDCNRMDYIAYQASLSMGFSRQEYWNGLLFPSPGDPLDPGIEPLSLVSSVLAGRFFTIELLGKPGDDGAGD